MGTGLFGARPVESEELQEMEALDDSRGREAARYLQLFVQARGLA